NLGDTPARGFLEYFPERNSLLFLDSAVGNLYEKNLTSGNWSVVATAYPDLAGDGIAGSYNPIQKVVVLGGGYPNNPSNKWWKYDASGAFTRIDNAPVM